MSSAKFITLEGIDGAGKSTHLKTLSSILEQQGIRCVVTREPGGTPLGEKLRELVLHQAMHIETETLLMFAARREHLHQVILPALKQNTWVISDRFTDATFAYQGGGRGIDALKLSILEQWVQDSFQPDLTLLFDVPEEISKERLARNVSLDRFEQEEQAFFKRVRKAYLARAEQFPNRIRIIDSSKPIADVQDELKQIIHSKFL